MVEHEVCEVDVDEQLLVKPVVAGIITLLGAMVVVLTIAAIWR